MRIGVPREIKTHEYRVGMTPSGVRELTETGHSVIVESGAGLVGRGGTLDVATAEEALQHRFAAYDKDGEEHVTLLSYPEIRDRLNR